MLTDKDKAAGIEPLHDSRGRPVAYSVRGITRGFRTLLAARAASRRRDDAERRLAQERRQRLERAEAGR